MVNQRVNQFVPLSVRLRCVLGLAGSLLAGLWIIAIVLKPSGAGMGTHQQLGLPPCTFKTLTGLRCPACGMTTAWSHAVRGQWRQALAASVTGTWLALGALPAAAWLSCAAACGRWLGFRPKESVLAWLAGAGVAGIVLEWVWRLVHS